MYKVTILKNKHTKTQRTRAAISILFLLLLYWCPLVLGLYNGVVNAFEPSYIDRYKIPDLYHNWNGYIKIMYCVVINKEKQFWLL